MKGPRFTRTLHGTFSGPFPFGVQRRIRKIRRLRFKRFSNATGQKSRSLSMKQIKSIGAGCYEYVWREGDEEVNDEGALRGIVCLKDPLAIHFSALCDVAL